MRRDTIAEWILATVTEPERAATIVGDLLEAPATREGARFWFPVLRSAGSLLWGGFAAGPRRMLSLAGQAWLLLSTQLLAVTLLAGATAGHLGAWFWIYKPLTAAASLGIAYRIGRWTARRAPGRELSACLALTALSAAIVGVAALASTAAHVESTWGVDVTGAAFYIGALRVRHERAVRA
jgi:hypothetical protein